MTSGLKPRCIWEVSNQLEGYVDSDTEERLANFLIREGKEAAKLAERIVELEAALAWRKMDSAPLDGTIINALARYEGATAGFPRYIGYNQERKVWLEYSRNEPAVVIPWAWRPRPSWPDEWKIK